MFQIDKRQSQEGLEVVTVFNKTAKLSVSVLPQLGGMLNAYTVNGQNVIEGVSLKPNGRSDYLSSAKSAFLFPFPNRIAGGRFHFNGKKHQLLCNEQTLSNAIHGFVFEKTFIVKNTNCSEEEGCIVLQYNYDGKLEGYPYPFELLLEYNLNLSGKLFCSCKIKSTGQKTMPFDAGWHHYFTLGETVDYLELSCSPKHRWLLDSKMIPTGEKISIGKINGQIGHQIYDDCFSLENPIVSLKDLQKKELVIDCGANFPFLQIYTPPHRRSIAIEPMTCLPDVFNNNNGLLELKPGETSVFSFSMLLKSQMHD